ncbi:cyclin-dependent protein kinase inhibitor SMR2-like [Vigna umbellata]|uniref:cyclin-dependent protein kinase inhibitor SMR2-like n=1 Tax=Vigna umbellata TaxID=87088 RepID=UPI001F5E3E2C|nr:cyclin-dependent protein kinase inhibitor SMR2-like [Vigna umbellata]
MSSDSTAQAGPEAMILRVVAAKDGSIQDLQELQELQEFEECKTPTSSSNKIPTIETCPPAPRKRRRLQMQQFSSSIKRSSSNALNYVVRHDQEVESFFQSTFELSRVNKRCRSV